MDTARNLAVSFSSFAMSAAILSKEIQALIAPLGKWEAEEILDGSKKVNMLQGPHSSVGL
jgi:hypothetical protein